MGISELQTFLYVLASRFAHPPDRSHRCPRLRQGSRGFYVRAEHASLPPHASDMLAVRIQVIDGERTFTPPDSQPYRLLRTTAPASRCLPALCPRHPAAGKHEADQKCSRLSRPLHSPIRFATIA